MNTLNTLKIKGAIFDLDGTLLDSMIIWENIGYNYLISIGKTPREDLLENLRPMSLLQAAEYFISDYDVSLSVKEIMHSVNLIIEDFYKNVALPKDGVISFLEKLRQENVKMCVATATDKYLVEVALEHNHMLDYFENIFTCTEVGFGKDTPHIYHEAINSLGTKKSETYVFEDALYAIQTAKKANFNVIAVYDETAKSQWNEIKKLADIHIHSFDEMEGYLNEKSTDNCRL